MKVKLLSILLLAGSLWGSVANVYIASSAAGAANGTSCANAYAKSFFDAAGNWGAGAAQIGAGTTVHLCGTFTVASGTSGYLTFQAGGTVGNPITMVAETGAILQAAYWGEHGAIYSNGFDYITLDGQGTGIIRATANGTALANQGPPGCASTVCSSGINLQACDNCTVRNWTVADIYINIPPNDENYPGQATWAIYYLGGNNALITGNIVHDVKWAITYGGPGGTNPDNIEISYNVAYNTDHGVFVSDTNMNVTITDVSVHHNEFYDGANWDDNLNDNHHNGVHISSSSGNSTLDGVDVYSNYIHGDWGIHCTAEIYLSPGNDPGYVMRNTRVFNNVLVNGSATNFCGNGLISDWGVESAAIYNNTLIGSSNTDGLGIYLRELSPFQPVVKNNIFVNLLYGFYVPTNGTNPRPNSNYNDFYNVANLALVGGTGCCTTLANWQAETGTPDLNSLTSNPLLAPNFIPQTGSSMIRAGTNLTSLGLTLLNVDKASNPRPASGGWDIGALNATSPANRVGSSNQRRGGLQK